MDIETIDTNYQQLQKESQDTVASLTTLAGKLKVAADGGDANAREWMLDLKEIALSIQEEETQTTALLQSIHDFVVKELQSPPPVAPAPAPAPAQYPQQPPQYPQQGVLGGGSLSRFTGSGFGRAIVSGAGFGLGADLIGRLFR